jgi:hypothetical protein
MQKIIHNVETNEITSVDLTTEEIAELEIEKVKKAKIEADKLVTETANAAARQAILGRLGITADEAALLLGGN